MYPATRILCLLAMLFLMDTLSGQLVPLLPQLLDTMMGVTAQSRSTPINRLPAATLSVSLVLLTLGPLLTYLQTIVTASHNRSIASVTKRPG